MRDNHLHEGTHGGQTKDTESLGSGITGLCELPDMIRGTALRSSGGACSKYSKDMFYFFKPQFY